MWMKTVGRRFGGALGACRAPSWDPLGGSSPYRVRAVAAAGPGPSRTGCGCARRRRWGPPAPGRHQGRSENPGGKKTGKGGGGGTTDRFQIGPAGQWLRAGVHPVARTDHRAVREALPAVHVAALPGGDALGDDPGPRVAPHVDHLRPRVRLRDGDGGKGLRAKGACGSPDKWANPLPFSSSVFHTHTQAVGCD